MQLEQNNEQLNNYQTPEQLLEKADGYLRYSNPEDIKEQLDSRESKKEFIKKFKESIIVEAELDRSNYFETRLIQILGRINGTYSGEIDGSWGDDTQDSYLNTFTIDEQNIIKVTGNGLLKKTFIDGEKHEVLESEKEYITSEEKIAEMLTKKLDEVGISREYINQISNKANLFKEQFPELELYLGQGKLKEALQYLNEEKPKIDEIKDENLKEVFYSTIEALKYAEISNNPEKLAYLEQKFKIEVVLDCFETLNSDDSILWVENDGNVIYNLFKNKIDNILKDESLNAKELENSVLRESSNFRREIYYAVKNANPILDTIKLPFSDKDSVNEENIARLQKRFLKFEEVLRNTQVTTREEMYANTINSFINTKTDNPFTNKDLGFARKESTANLKSKMLNVFLGEYSDKFTQLAEEKFPEEKQKQLREEIKKELLDDDKYKDLKGKQLEDKIIQKLTIEINSELEKDIIKSLENNNEITGFKREALENYINLFDPKNEFGELSIDGKNILSEEILSIPLTAFIILRLSKGLFGVRQTIKAQLGVDFLEGATFEMLTKLRHDRGSLENFDKNYFSKDFWIGSAIGATLFGLMKIDKIKIKGIEYNIKTDGKTLADRGKNHLIETGIFTTVEGVGNRIDGKNIFEDGVSEKLLTNIGILYLVKLGYKPSEIGGILPKKMYENLDLKSSAIRAKSNAKMKGVGLGKADGVGILRVEDALSGSIENVIKGFNGIDSKISSDFKELLTRGGDTNQLEIEASKLIKQQVDLELGRLDVKGLKIQTKEQRDYVREYKLEKIAEFKKLVEAREKGEIPKEIDMKFGGRKWRLELNNVREMNEYFSKFVDRMREKNEGRPTNNY